MRTFYIFKINKEMGILLKNNPYNLYHTLEGIYFLDKANISLGKDLLDQLIVPIDKLQYNKILFEKNKDNDFYMKFKDTHRIINKYRNEDTNILVKSSYILARTNIINKDFTKYMPINDLFACDFENKDYFWLEQLKVL